MCELFVEHTRDDLEFIQEALAVDDLESLRLRAHRLKGSAYAFGAQRLGDRASELEALARSGSPGASYEASLRELLETHAQTTLVLGEQRATEGGRPET
jgi:HPt (histidine-containing phosphotransfer) domain-containing protein